MFILNLKFTFLIGIVVMCGFNLAILIGKRKVNNYFNSTFINVNQKLLNTLKSSNSSVKITIL